MFVFAVGPRYRLPITTMVVGTLDYDHTHRDRAGFSWKEPMTLEIRVPVVSLNSIHPIANDNVRAA